MWYIMSGVWHSKRRIWLHPKSQNTVDNVVLYYLLVVIVETAAKRVCNFVCYLVSFYMFVFFKMNYKYAE